MRKYVAGFVFCPIPGTPTSRVLLVRKNHPGWQDGLLNGIGGQIEGIETAHEAMVREFKEEAGYHTNEWEYFASEDGPGYSVFFFRHTIDPMTNWHVPFYNDRSEELEWHDPRNVKHPMVGNLRWLLPLALDPRPINCRVETTGDIRSIKTW